MARRKTPVADGPILAGAMKTDYNLARLLQPLDGDGLVTLGLGRLSK